MSSAVDLRRVRRAARGDVEAFAVLYEGGFRCAWGFAARRCGERSAAEALTETVLTQAFASLSCFPGGASWPAWLGAIAADCVADRLADERRICP